MALTTVDQGLLGTYAQYTGFKNRIINGAMVIDQRNAGASVTPTDGQYLVDRWVSTLTAASKFTAQQSSTAPAGFSSSLLLTSSSAYSITSGDAFAVSQKIEGYNFADFSFGTANAQPVSISFWVRSSLTGTFGGAIANSANNRSYPFSYTISAANTWEQKTVTITGDTTGTWIGATTGIGVRVWFSIGMGSTYSGPANAWTASAAWAPTGATSVVGTSGATFYITGVQLEKGSTATSFDYRPYTNELALCQRYYTGNSGVSLYCHPASTYARITITLPVSMRTAPSVAYFDNVGTASRYTTFATNDTPTNNISPIAFNSTVGILSNTVYILLPNSDAGVNAGFSYQCSAEL